MDEIEQLIDEVRQITSQYKAEVGGGRKQWPRAIREKVLRLRAGGLRLKEISERTGIPYFTVTAWSSEGRRSGFHSLPVVAAPKEPRLATVTVASRQPVPNRNKIATVAIKTPDGYVVQVPSVRDAILLMRLFRRSR